MLRLIPGLEQAEFVRFGMVHRNTYVNGPTVLRETWQVRDAPDAVLRRTDVRRRRLRRVGRVGPARRAERRGAGAAASRCRRRRGRRRSARWRTTCRTPTRAHYQPSNITFGIMRPLATAAAQARWQRKLAHVRARARGSGDWLDAWIAPTAAGVAMTEHISRRSSQYLALNRNASRAHRPRLRERPRAVPRPRRRRRRRQGARPRRRRRSIAPRSAASSASCIAQGQSRATAARKLAARAHVPALPAPRRARSTTIPARSSATPKREQSGCRRTCPKTR